MGERLVRNEVAGLLFQRQVVGSEAVGQVHSVHPYVLECQYI